MQLKLKIFYDEENGEFYGEAEYEKYATKMADKLWKDPQKIMKLVDWGVEIQDVISTLLERIYEKEQEALQNDWRDVVEDMYIAEFEEGLKEVVVETTTPHTAKWIKRCGEEWCCENCNSSAMVWYTSRSTKLQSQEDILTKYCPDCGCKMENHI